MKHFRMNYLKKQHLAIVPEKGYDTADTQSSLALKYMHWYAETNNVQIQTANSQEGEKKVGNYKLDGWIEEKQMGIEVHGCAWHGCIKCYPSDQDELPNGKTAGMVRERDQARMDFILSQIPQMHVIWECEINEMLTKDKKMKAKFDEYLDNGPLDIREAFCGGRTGALKLYHAVGPDEILEYYDVTSLYPFIK